VYKGGPGVRPGPREKRRERERVREREREIERERRFRVYKEAPGFRPASPIGIKGGVKIMIVEEFERRRMRQLLRRVGVTVNNRSHSGIMSTQRHWMICI
jgi:hypothetical protein